MKAILILFFFLPALSFATSDLTDAIFQCELIKDDKERLACFDEEIKVLGENMYGDEDDWLSGDAAVEYITPFLKMWSPSKVELDGKVLTIVLPQDKVTDKIYTSIIQTGLCGSVYMGDKKWNGIGDVVVLNQHEHQGWIFEGSYEDCEDLGKLSGKKFDQSLMSMSRLK